MEIIKVKTGYLEENCYIIRKDNQCLVIDPGDDSNLILSEIGNLEVLGILITHHHFDHVGALKDIKEKYQVEVYDFTSCQEQEYLIGTFSFQVIKNPGHSKDSISFYFKDENIMFVGDFVFCGTVGRCDLEGGNFKEMLDSIQKLKKYPDFTILYPGHGQATTLGQEKQNNPYFKN